MNFVILKVSTVGGQQRIPLSEGQTLSFGASQFADYTFEDVGLDKVHLRFALSRGCCFMECLSATDCCMVNGVAKNRTRIYVGDRLVLNPDRLEIEIGGQIPPKLVPPLPQVSVSESTSLRPNNMVDQSTDASAPELILTVTSEIDNYYLNTDLLVNTPNLDVACLPSFNPDSEHFSYQDSIVVKPLAEPSQPVENETEENHDSVNSVPVLTVANEPGSSDSTVCHSDETEQNETTLESTIEPSADIAPSIKEVLPKIEEPEEKSILEKLLGGELAEFGTPFQISTQGQIVWLESTQVRDALQQRTPQVLFFSATQENEKLAIAARKNPLMRRSNNPTQFLCGFQQQSADHPMIRDIFEYCSLICVMSETNEFWPLVRDPD